MKGAWHFKVKFTGKGQAQVMSNVFEIGMKGTFFSHWYLNYSFFSENCKVGCMNCPSITVACKRFGFLSVPIVEFKIYVSGIWPFFCEYPRNWNIIPCFGRSVVTLGATENTGSSSGTGVAAFFGSSSFFCYYYCGCYGFFKIHSNFWGFLPLFSTKISLVTFLYV